MGSSDDPFRYADRLLEQINAKVIFLDFHAEATSEKVAFGWYVDGRVTAVVGTHTHIPTADENVLTKGTAYITDVGMTGPYDSVIGVKKELVIERFLTGMPARFEAAAGDVRLCAVVVECDNENGRAQRIQRLMLQ
jgi:metallophosphoesterase (TIGR00282 family)